MRQRWLKFEDAVTLRNRIRDELHYPDDLLAIERGGATILSGLRVVIAPRDSTRPFHRVRNIEEAQDALRLIRIWEQEMGIAGESEEPEVSQEPEAAQVAS